MDLDIRTQHLFEQDKLKLNFDLGYVQEQIDQIQEMLEPITLSLELDVKKSGLEVFSDIASSVGSVLSIAETLITYTQLGKLLEKLQDKFKDGKRPAEAYTTVINKLANNFDRISPKVKEIKDTLNPMSKELEKAGKAITEGLIRGFTSMDEETKKAVIKVTTDIIRGVKKEMKISSPSKVMQELGSFISEGLGDGIEKGAKFAEDAAKALCDNCEDEFDDLSDATDKLNGKKISFGGGLAAVAALATGIVAIFKNLMENNEEFSSKMQEVWGTLQEVFQPVVDMLASFFESFILGSETTGGAMDTVMEILTVASEFICGVISAITQFWNENGQAIMAKIQEIFDYLMPIVEGIKTFVGGLFEFIMGIFTGDTEAIKNGCSALWEGIKQIFTPIIEFLPTSSLRHGRA